MLNSRAVAQAGRRSARIYAWFGVCIDRFDIRERNEKRVNSDGYLNACEMETLRTSAIRNKFDVCVKCAEILHRSPRLWTIFLPQTAGQNQWSKVGFLLGCTECGFSKTGTQEVRSPASLS